MTRKLPSLSVFFPFYNDEGTVERQIICAYAVGKRLAADFEVIALHGGDSADNTYSKIMRMKEQYPPLMVVDKSDNTEGYAVIKHGFSACTKEWIFYTDGDAQYHLEEDLERLIDKQAETKADFVNGYKRKRGDGFVRTFLGTVYSILSRKILRLPIRDVDCDFRLIRKSLIDNIVLTSAGSSVLPELVKKAEVLKARIVEVPVSHYKRAYGTSTYSLFDLVKEKVVGDAKLYLEMRKISKKHEK